MNHPELRRRLKALDQDNRSDCLFWLVGYMREDDRFWEGVQQYFNYEAKERSEGTKPSEAEELGINE